MTQTQYQRGANFERKIMEDLTARGYFCVRSAGSHQLADLVALSDGGCRPLLIQAKCGKSPIKTDDWNGLYDLAMKYDSDPVLATLDTSERKHEIVYSLIVSSLNKGERREGASKSFDP